MELPGSGSIPLSSDLLRGQIIDDEGNVIPISPQLLNKIRETYERRIVPLMGRFSEYGCHLPNPNSGQYEPCAMDFIMQCYTPTDLFNELKQKASKEGRFIYGDPSDLKRITSYQANDPNQFTIVVLDHLRSLTRKPDLTEKKSIDRFMEYVVQLRNWCSWTFVIVVHTNKMPSDSSRLKVFGDELYPTGNDIRGSGYIAKRADYLFSMLNPNDDSYWLQKHFGFVIRDADGNKLSQDLRMIHLVESQHCAYPQHFAVRRNGANKSFSMLNDDRMEN